MVEAPLWSRRHYGRDVIMVEGSLWSRRHYGRGATMVEAPLWSRRHYGRGATMVEASFGRGVKVNALTAVDLINYCYYFSVGKHCETES